MIGITGREAVSPIVGTVLLIGICVVFASAMFVWVSGFVFQSGFVPTCELAIIDYNKTSGRTNYTILIKTLRPRTDPKDIKCYIYDKDFSSKAVFNFPAKSGDGNKVPSSSGFSGNLTWYDLDKNGWASSYDQLNLSVDVPGTVLADCSFCLRHNPTGECLIGVVGLE